MTTQETATPFRVEVTWKAGTRPGNQPMAQSFNCDTLDHMWTIVGRHKNMPSVRRVRVWAQIAVFEITQS